MRLGLRMGLNSRQGGGSALDADARLYIAAVETALGTPIATALPSATSNPKRIISDFIKAEKAAGRWSLHKRIYLPIYANAAASAIDMVGRNIGTFTASGVTHAAGYVQGDGATGYFNFNVIPTTLGLTSSSGMVFAVHKAEPIGTLEMVSVSSIDGSDITKVSDLSFRNTSIKFSYNTTTTGSGAVSADVARSFQNGIFIASRQSGNRSIFRRNSSAFTNLITQAGGDFGTIPSTKTFVSMRSQFSTGGAYSNAQMGAYGAGLGMTELQADGFSLNLKTLYEGLTGITLP